MSRKKVPAPADVLAEALGKRPAGSRCALLLDPDSVADVGRAVTDSTGRVWEAVIYRGDDVVTRRAWARAWSSEKPVLLVLSRAEGDEVILDASSLADLAGHAEGDPIDLSLLGYFRRLFPRVSPPPQTLREHRRAFLDHTEEVVKAYPRFKERWGEPDVWGRAELVTILALARFPNLTLPDLWCDEPDLIAFAAHAIWLLCHPAIAADDLPAVAEVIWASSRHSRSAAACRWLDLAAGDLAAFRGEIAGFLVVRDLFAATAPPHLDDLLKAKLPPSTFDPEEIASQVAVLVAAIKDSWHWSHIQSRAREFLTAARLEKVGDLVGSDASLLSRLISDVGTAPVILGFLVRQAVLDRCRGVTAAWPPWVASLSTHSLLAAYDRGETLEPPAGMGAGDGWDAL